VGNRVRPARAKHIYALAIPSRIAILARKSLGYLSQVTVDRNKPNNILAANRRNYLLAVSAREACCENGCQDIRPSP